MKRPTVDFCDCERCGRDVICSFFNGEMLCEACIVEARAEEYQKQKQIHL